MDPKSFISNTALDIYVSKHITNWKYMAKPREAYRALRFVSLGHTFAVNYSIKFLVPISTAISVHLLWNATAKNQSEKL